MGELDTVQPAFWRQFEFIDVQSFPDYQRTRDQMQRDFQQRSDQMHADFRRDSHSMMVFFFVGVAVLIVISLIANHGRRGHRRVFQQLDPRLQDRVRRAPRANRRYTKTRCDGCGAPIAKAAQIAPSGLTTCAYCGSTFNVVKTDDLPD